MIDPKAVDTLEVFRNGERVGTLLRTMDGSAFRYTDEFLASAQEPIALHLPKTVEGTEAHGTANLPTYFAGLLPEGIMQDAIVRAGRLSKDDLFSQLAVTGYNAIGDITTRVPGQPPPKTPSKPNEVRELLSQMLQGELRTALSAHSGVQPKLSIGQAVASTRGAIAIVKVEPEAYPGLMENEAYFMRLARSAGLKAADVDLQEGALLVHRFDRIKRKNQPPEQIHVEDALQVMNRYPLAKYSLDYTEIMDAAERLEVAKSVQLDLLRLYAYSYMIGNGDLHAKNVSFEYNRDTHRWTLTPAYDLVCTLPYFEADAYGRRMALGLDEQFGDFNPEDFRKVGHRYGLPGKAVDSMLRQVVQGIMISFERTPPPLGDGIRQELEARVVLNHNP